MDRTQIATGDEFDPDARRREIRQLDPVADCRRIAQLFHRDFSAALLPQIATGFLMTIAPPRMTRILIKSGEIEHRARKRLTDQLIIHHEMMSHGFGPGRGRDAVRRMNEMHRKYDIHPEDFVAVSVEATVGPVLAARAYGWRKITQHEVLALIEFERIRALHMNVRDLPATFEEMIEFRDDYYARQVYYAPQNRVLADSALAGLSTLAPEHVRSRIERVVLGLTDPRIVAALGFEEPSASYRQRVAGAMRDYAFENRPGMPGGGPVAGLIASLYPDGYDISRLGTHLSPAGTRPHAPTTEVSCGYQCAQK